MVRRATEFNAELQQRRTIRAFSDRPVPREVIEQALLAGGSAPSGAHRQPWHFVVVGDPEVKREIRAAAERTEAKFYQHAPRDWLEALAPLGTDASKPYIEIAPLLIAV
ncbi:MAG: nitroreductase family protein, partial [Gemmatimonadota bacterium]